MSGVFNNTVAQRGERYTPEDGFFLMEDGRRYYTAERQKSLRAKLAKLNAPLLIVLDKISESQVADAWRSARSLLADNQPEEAVRAVRSLRDVRKDEAGFLGSLGEAAIRTGALPRLHFWGLSAADILLYLPDGERLVKEKKSQRLGSAKVRDIVGSLDRLHPDLTDLMYEIDRLSRTFGTGIA